MNPLIEILNRFGDHALHFAWPMFWQSSALIAILFATEFVLRRHVRAAVRYAFWLVLLVKLLLPPTLALPTGIAWWLLPAANPASPHTTKFVISYDTDVAPSLPPLPTPAFTPPRPTMSAAAWAILGWSAISAGLLAWLMARWQQVVRGVKRAMPASAQLSELFDEAKSSTGLHQTVRLRLTDQAMSPAVCGLFRPVILLPQSLVEKLPPVQLRAVLLHELTHLRRGDVWMNCAQALVQVVYWWHPLRWLANARIRRIREEAVDDAVMLALRADAETYAPTLLEVAKLAFQRPLASLGLVGILESRSALRQRIERLTDFRAPRKAGLTLVSLCGICIFSATAVPMGEAPIHSSNANNPALNAGDLTRLSTRTFKVDAKTFLTSLAMARKQAGWDAITNEVEIGLASRDFFTKLGVDLSPPKAIFFNNDPGLLLVRATEQDLNTIEKAVQILNMMTPQIHIKARFIEVPEQEVQHLGTNLIPAGVTNATGILNNPDFRVAIRTL